MQYTAADFNLPPLASVERFAELVGYKEGLIRRCARETKTVNGWPPLPTITMPDGQKRIAAPDGAAWLSLVIKLGLS